MGPDIAIVSGLVLVVNFLPRLVSAYAHQRSRRIPRLFVLSGVAAITVGLLLQPGRPRLSGVPEAVVRIVAEFLR